MAGHDGENRIERSPTAMSGDGSWTETAVEGLRGALLLTPVGRMAEASQVLQQLRASANQQRVIESADILGIGLDTPMDVHVASVVAFTRMNNGTFIIPLDNIPRSGPQRTAALKAIANTERADPGSFNRLLQRDPEAVQTYQDAVDAAVADPESVESAPVSPAPVTGPTSGQVRISGQCRPIRICFWPRAKFRNNPRLRREYERQLRLQERGINAMPPGQLAQNRADFCDLGRRPAIEARSAAANRVARTAYSTAVRQRMKAQAALLRGRTRIAAELSIPLRLRSHMRKVAVLHNPDKIAGGNPTVVFTPADATQTLANRPASTVGDRSVNGSIGSSWGTCGSPNSRSSRLARHAEQQDRNGCPSTQAQLEICRD